MLSGYPCIWDSIWRWSNTVGWRHLTASCWSAVYWVLVTVNHDIHRVLVTVYHDRVSRDCVMWQNRMTGFSIIDRHNLDKRWKVDVIYEDRCDGIWYGLNYQCIILENNWSFPSNYTCELTFRSPIKIYNTDKSSLRFLKNSNYIFRLSNLSYYNESKDQAAYKLIHHTTHFTDFVSSVWGFDNRT